MVLSKLHVLQNFSQISWVLQSRFFFKGKEVSVKAPICLLVFINFEVFLSLDIEFNNTTFKFPRNEVNPKLSEFHKT